MKIREIIPVALGDEMPDVLLKNLKFFNVFTNELEENNIAIYKKRIAGIGDYTEGKKVIDLDGKIVLPGFIDAHLHIESSMLAPRQFAKAVLPRGTTTVIADPHEITNVLGIEGLKYMIESTEGIPLNVYIAVPSAVPATKNETSGAILGAEDIVGFVDNYPRRIIALGEVMNFPGVLEMDPELITKIEILRHKYKKIDGHCPGLSGKKLNAYINAFIRSDHECSNADEALEKVRRGMHIFIREGTAAKNLESLVKAVNNFNYVNFSFCTDDRDPLDIIKEGHIDYLIKKSIKLGLDPFIAIKMATINPAKHFNLRSMGAIAPGYKADLVVINNLEDFNVEMVFKDSKIVSEKGKLSVAMEGIYHTLPEKVGIVNIPKITLEDLKIKDKGKKIRVIEMFEGLLETKELIKEPKIENGYIMSDIENDILKLLIVERHKGKNYSLGFVKGLSIKSGAVGTSIGHDSHNIGIVGTNDEDMILALNEIKNMNGGIVVVKDKQIISKMPLPIAGLMTDSEPEEAIKNLTELKNALKILECEKDIFMTLAFVQLSVIPELKITDKGLVNVNTQEIVDIFSI
jgi:adenine deaminase